jgi:hypothetical protein
MTYISNRRDRLTAVGRAGHKNQDRSTYVVTDGISTLNWYKSESVIEACYTIASDRRDRAPCTVYIDNFTFIDCRTHEVLKGTVRPVNDTVSLPERV